MPHFDLSGHELVGYDPVLTAPDDLQAFWGQTLAETRSHPLDPVLVPAASPLTVVQSYDVSWRGFGGDPIRGWLHLPAGRVSGDDPLPAVIQYQGYGGGRGLVFEDVFWAAAGYAHLVMDTRGQGSGWSTGDTPDPAGSAPAQPGYMTRGLTDPHDYYYRRVYADAVRAVEFMGTVDEVDAQAIVVTGASQGGGLSLAVAALADGVRAVMPDVPFLCDFRRSSQVALTNPYLEIVRYLAAHRDHEDAAFATLAYFDGAVLARRASAPALFSVALMDETCPPSTVYAAYNAYGGPKEIVTYPYNDHEGGEAFHKARQATWLAQTLAAGATVPGRPADPTRPG
ncbi:MAG: acetylxylan esterase [Solirubrobacteraceae bacterium]